MRCRETAICVRAVDYSETSQVLTFLTRGAGVARVIGKGTKRPKSKSGGMIDLLAEGQLVYTAGKGEALGTLIEFTETVSHRGLRGDAERLTTGLYMLEVVGALVGEGDVHAEVFDVLHNALSRLSDADAPVAAVLAWFQWRTLRHVGLLGQLLRCVACDAPTGRGAVWFSSAMGGLVCRRCRTGAADTLEVDAETLAAAEVVAAAEGGRRTPLADSGARKLNRLLGYHISQQIGRRLRMGRYVLGAGPTG